ncbi:MAG TPA: hypothetical protein VNA20_18275 [Frankiaceae bacterium]|nr:hypothetical protein [Frankiaceae bacterium]
MIVVSGALVLVALIFLIIGLLQEGLQMIWLSIGTSVVAGVFLLLGALQRRGTPATAAGDTADTGTEALERVTAVSLRPRETESADAGDTAAAAGGSEGDVYVVPGRPRYHVENCRFLAGRPDVETVPVEQARDDGYTSCGVCKPDAALAAATTTEDSGGDTARDEALADETAETATLTLAEETSPEPEEAAPAPAKRAPAKRTRTAAASGAASAASAAAATTAAAKPAKKTTAAKSTAASQVVVIPDRGKYHVQTCRFVRDVPGTVNLSKATAKRQGYVPCGVCKPS